eukprot:ctg_668.g313
MRGPRKHRRRRGGAVFVSALAARDSPWSRGPRKRGEGALTRGGDHRLEREGRSGARFKGLESQSAARATVCGSSRPPRVCRANSTCSVCPHSVMSNRVLGLTPGLVAAALPEQAPDPLKHEDADPFWQQIEPFFAPITAESLQWMHESATMNNGPDTDLAIPQLGHGEGHAAEDGEAEDGRVSEVTRRQRSRHAAAGANSPRLSGAAERAPDNESTAEAVERAVRSRLEACPLFQRLVNAFVEVPASADAAAGNHDQPPFVARTGRPGHARALSSGAGAARCSGTARARPDRRQRPRRAPRGDASAAVATAQRQSHEPHLPRSADGRLEARAQVASQSARAGTRQPQPADPVLGADDPQVQEEPAPAAAV